MKTRMANTLTTTIVLLFTIFCQAQKKPDYIPPSIDDEEIPVAKTELPVPEEGKDYVVQYFKGITDGVESRIAVKKLGYIIRPAMVQVISEDGRELAIELVKKNWDDVVRSGKTIEGKFESSFKTAMEFGIKISAQEKGIPFIVAVSAGIELFPPSNLFVDASTMRPSAASVEVDLVGDESGESNNTLYIIIALALVGILVLLAILVFKKKGKGTASMILFLLFSISADAGLVQSLGGSPHGKATAGLANFLIDSMGKRYGRGGFSGGNPLSEDDKGHEPNLDPRGQPSLPSSCYEIARMGRSGSSGGSGSNVGNGLSGADNPTNSEGNITLSTGTGGMAGAVGGSETGDVIGQGDRKQNKDYANERQKIINDFRHYRELALDRRNQGQIDALDIWTQSDQEAIRQRDRDILKANGDTEQLNIALELYSITLRTITNTQQVTNAQLGHDYNLDIADLAVGEIIELASLREREAADNREQQNNDGGEKDPNRQPKKDPSRRVVKGDPGDEDPTKGGANSPTAPGDSPNPQSGRDKEKEAGCKCLEEAYANLQKRRYSLEKLLKIGQHTKKVTDFGISFGDDFSGVHGVSGLVWQTKRAEILKSIDKFDVTYTNKYNELIDKLYDTLIQIDECELKLGYENWYSQSGFIYYEFMKVRYASYK